MEDYNKEDEAVCELAEQILKVKRAYAESPDLYRAAAKKLIEDAKLVRQDKELKKISKEEPEIMKSISIEIGELDEKEEKKSIRDKMEGYAKKKA